jgi:Ca2+-binding RTX toxin-like protein
VPPGLRPSPCAAALIAAAALLGLVQSASAATVVSNPPAIPSRVLVEADAGSPGVADDISVTGAGAGSYVVRNTHDTVVCGAVATVTCLQVDPNAVQVSGSFVGFELDGHLQDDTIDTDAVDVPAIVRGGDGNDTISTGGGADRIAGGSGNDVVTPGNGNDDAVGDAGNDRFVMGAAPDGSDAFSGRDGKDVVDYGLRTTPVVVSIDAAINDGAPGENDNVYTSTEDVRGGTGADTLTGSPTANSLDGGPGNDLLTGLAGNDNVAGGEGDDTFDEGAAKNGADGIAGNAGSDTVDYGDRTARVIVVLTKGATPGDGEGGELDEVYESVENVTAGAGDDRLAGNTAGNRLLGGGGADLLQGYTGNDVLDGGDGNDSLYGLEGDDDLSGGVGDDSFEEDDDLGSDAIAGGPGSDWARYSHRTADLSLTIDGVANDGAAGEQDNLFLSTENAGAGMGKNTLVGSNGPNRLAAVGGPNTFVGGPGNDNLTGGGGDDTFLEGSSANGADGFAGGPGFDVVTYAERTTPLQVKLDELANDGAAGENDSVYNSTERVIGGSAADLLEGNNLANRLEGGPGNDTIRAFAGTDMIVDQNGDADVLLDCGNDTLEDTVYADAADTWTGCYQVFVAPAPAG